MPMVGRLGVWCAGVLASLSPAVCLADTSQRWITPSGLESHASGRDSVTVAWIAREGAIRGYNVRVACASDRVACPEQEWFVARRGGAPLASYVVRLPVPPGARTVRVQLRSRRRAGKAPARRRAIRGPGSRAPAATRGRPRPGQCAALGAAKWSGSLVAPHAARIEPLEDAAPRSRPPRDRSARPPLSASLPAALRPSSPRTPDSGRISLIKRSPAVGGCEGEG
jgi:hypothetical protein